MEGYKDGRVEIEKEKFGYIVMWKGDFFLSVCRKEMKSENLDLEKMNIKSFEL
jgi:hypothetical protein